MHVEETVRAVRAQIEDAARMAGRDPAEITLCAATKVQTSQTIREVIAAGVTVCGENHVQELRTHWAEDAYAGARVHLIGHLQTNKVKYVVGKCALIESVDSEHLLEALDAQAGKLGLCQDILLEVNMAEEGSKTGLSPERVPYLVEQAAQCPNLRLRGLMAMTPISAVPGGNRPYFAAARQLFVDIKDKWYHNETDIDCLSMGMSGDFSDAILEGATLIRVGTALFGPRPALCRKE